MELPSWLRRLEIAATILLVAAQCQALALTRRQNGSVSNALHHRAWQKSLVLNDGQPRLYIDGGEISTWSGQGDGLMPNSEDNTVNTPGFFWTAADNTTHMIPLDQSWSVDNVPIVDTEKPDEFTGLIAGALWPSEDGETFYSYNGGLFRYDPGTEYVPIMNGNQIWQFTPDSSGHGDWEQVVPASDSNFTTLVKTSGALEASHDGLSFAVGGFLNGVPVEGMVMYNESTQEWWNISIQGYSYLNTTNDGAAHFVPNFGPAGLLLLFGGFINDVRVSFDLLYMFEPLSQQWRKQKVTGTPPSPVSLLCVVGVEGDDGTYEIFLHGGSADDTETSIDQGSVFSLTLPGFHWQKHSPDPSFGRSHHSCSVGANRQMIVSGGATVTSESTTKFIPVEPWPHAIGVYDLSALEWKTDFDADAAPYVTPDVIKQYYRVNGSGPAEWTDDGVEAWFQQARVRESGSSGSNSTQSGGDGGSRDTSSNGGNGDNNDEINDNGDSNTGAIAGGVVGGVVGLALVGGILWFVLRRRRRRNTAPAYHHSDGAAAPVEHHGKQPVGDYGARAEMDGRGRVSELPSPDLGGQRAGWKTEGQRADGPVSYH